MEQLQLAFESRAYELAYERTSRQVEAVCDAERLRQMRVRVLLLEEDNDDLRVKLSQEDGRLHGLQTFNNQVQKDLEVCGRRLEHAQGDLRIKSREVETLKAMAKHEYNITVIE